MFKILSLIITYVYIYLFFLGGDLKILKFFVNLISYSFLVKESKSKDPSKVGYLSSSQVVELIKLSNGIKSVSIG